MKESASRAKATGAGKVLRHLRKTRGLLQDDIAMAVGVHPSQIPKWELERQGMRFDSLLEFLDALCVGVEEFGRLLDRLRRGEPLVQDSDREVIAVEELREEPPRRKGRAAVFLWEEESEDWLSELDPEAQKDLGIALSELRYALDQLRPPEERDRGEEEEEQETDNGGEEEG